MDYKVGRAGCQTTMQRPCLAVASPFSTSWIPARGAGRSGVRGVKLRCNDRALPPLAHSPPPGFPLGGGNDGDLFVSNVMSSSKAKIVRSLAKYAKTIPIPARFLLRVWGKMHLGGCRIEEPELRSRDGGDAKYFMQVFMGFMAMIGGRRPMG